MEKKKPSNPPKQMEKEPLPPMEQPKPDPNPSEPPKPEDDKTPPKPEESKEPTEEPKPEVPEEHPWELVYQQFHQAQKRFPQMNLLEEMKNPAFGRLLAAGFPVETAFEMVHFKELVGRAMAQVAQQTALELTQALQSGSLRPREGALGAPQGGVYVRDPRYFTPKQREDYRNRAMRGERVIF